MNNNKTAIITGGSRGLGKDMALKLAEKGLDVILTYHSKKDESAPTSSRRAQSKPTSAAAERGTTRKSTK